MTKRGDTLLRAGGEADGVAASASPYGPAAAPQLGASGLERIAVTFYQRRPIAGVNHSVEGYFQAVRDGLHDVIEPRLALSSCVSRGAWRRVWNVIEAPFRQSTVNHITGDIHYVGYLLARDKTILTVLDCVFAQNTSGWRRRTLQFLWYTVPVRRARIVTTISEFTRQELLRHVDIAPDKVRVVPVCISPSFVPIEKQFDATRPKILQVGTGPNKNVDRLARALRDLPCQLVLVGLLSDRQRQALAENNISYTSVSDVSDSDLINLYASADIVTFPSLYEGFGMPILEANAVGRPVVTSCVASMPEVAGDAACLVDPYDASSIRNAIDRVIQDEQYRRQLVANGFRNAQRFSQDHVAKMYFDIYNEIAIAEQKLGYTS